MVYMVRKRNSDTGKIEEYTFQNIYKVVESKGMYLFLDKSDNIRYALREDYVVEVREMVLEEQPIDFTRYWEWRD